MYSVLAAASAFLTLGVQSTAAQSYQLVKSYNGSTFFDEWAFYGHYDNLTQGDVNFVTRDQSGQLAYVNEQGHAIIKVDNTSYVPWNQKRNTVRIQSHAAYNPGSLVVFDANHIPFGCSVWGAFWMTGYLWPNDGEIDILESVNMRSFVQGALHTEGSCTLQQGSGTGNIVGTECLASANENAGCTVESTDPNAFGQNFANAGGGVYALEFAQDHVSLWFFTRYQIPGDLSSGGPNPSSWGKPLMHAETSTGCDISQMFGPQALVLDITLCGSLAGNPAVFSQTCGGQCYTNYVLNAGAYGNAYFDISSIKVYGTSQDVVTTLHPNPNNKTASSSGGSGGGSGPSKSDSAAFWSPSLVNAGALTMFVGVTMLFL